MGSRKFIEQARLGEVLAAWAGDRQVLVPVRDGDAVVFQSYDGQQTPDLSRQPTVPPKQAVFPQTETLLRFRRVKDPEDLTRSSIEVEETLEAPQTVVFGSRPCGARGFDIFDPVFDCQRIRDPYYATRRENTSFVSLVCTRAENTCFCSAVGGGPADAKGSDMLLVPVDGGYVGEAVSDKGEVLIALGPWSDAGDKAAQADEVKHKTAAAMTQPFETDGVADQVLSLSENTSFWQQFAAKCIGCGACTYLCPTCYCFDITDESQGMGGERIRTWDSCMACMYTTEASGHNPRPTQAHRLGNRIAHKYGYYPKVHGGLISCTGCGRCIKSCPVSIDIREIVIEAKAHKHA